MNKTIKALESLGQSNSIKQYNSLDDMLRENSLSANVMDDIFNGSSELIIFHAPGDDDDDQD
jgi:hypothetical protein